MARILGSTTLTLTPTQTISLGFQPTWAIITVSEKSGSDNAAHTSEGKVNTNPGPTVYQYCQSTFADADGADTFKSSAHLVQHYERVGGVITKVLSASFHSFTPSGIKLNVDIPNNNYQVLIEAGN